MEAGATELRGEACKQSPHAGQEDAQRPTSWQVDLWLRQDLASWGVCSLQEALPVCNRVNSVKLGEKRRPQKGPRDRSAFEGENPGSWLGRAEAAALPRQRGPDCQSGNPLNALVCLQLLRQAKEKEQNKRGAARDLLLWEGAASYWVPTRSHSPSEMEGATLLRAADARKDWRHSSALLALVGGGRIWHTWQLEKVLQQLAGPQKALLEV